MNFTRILLNFLGYIISLITFKSHNEQLKGFCDWELSKIKILHKKGNLNDLNSAMVVVMVETQNLFFYFIGKNCQLACGHSSSLLPEL